MTIVVFGENPAVNLVGAGELINDSSEREIEIGTGKTVTFLGSIENTNAPVQFYLDMAGDDGVFFQTPGVYEPEYPPVGASPAAIPFFINFENIAAVKMRIRVAQISVETNARMVCCIK